MANRSRLALILLAAVVSLTQRAAAADQVGNPLYKQWSAYKVGTSVTHRETLAGTSELERTTLTLIELTPDKAVVQRTAKSPTGATRPSEKMEIPARVDSDKAQEVRVPQSRPGLKVTVERNGEQTINAGGKSYKCQRFEITEEEEHQLPVQTTEFISAQVPGGMVYSERTWFQNSFVSELVSVNVVE